MSAALIRAIHNKNFKLVQEILDNEIIDVNHRYSEGNSVVCHALETGNLDIIKLLLSQENLQTSLQTAKDGSTLLHLALHNTYLLEPKRNLEIILSLLIAKDKSVVNISDIYNRIPIHYINHFLHAVSLPVVKLLVENGSNINQQDKYGRTCLHYMCFQHHFDSINFLLTETSMDPQIKDCRGQTPLYFLLKEEPKDNSRLNSDKLIISSLIDRTIVPNPETGEYDFNDFFPIVWAACASHNKILGIGEALFHKFYSKNNSKYKFYEKLEASIDESDQVRFYIYALLHDKVSEFPNISYVVNYKSFTRAYLIFLKMKLSDECDPLVLELFEYFESIKIYQNLELFSYEIGYHLAIHHKSHTPFFFDYLKYFIDNKFNCNAIFAGILSRFNLDIITKAAPLLIPFTSNLTEIIIDFTKLNGNFFERFYCRGEKVYVKNLLQKYGDCVEVAKMPEFKTKMLSLKRLSRDCFRKYLLENTETYAEFFEKLNKLKEELPKRMFSYLKLEVED